MLTEFINETKQAMEDFLDQMSFSYVAKLEKDDEDSDFGYMMLDFLSRGNHTILMKIDPQKEKLFMDYYPGIKICDFNNVSGHRLIESINTQINDISILVMENREVLYRGVIDLHDTGASVESIRRVYECNIFVTVVFGDTLEECLVHPRNGKDYISVAKEFAHKLSEDNTDEDESDDCGDLFDFFSDDTCSYLDDEDDTVELDSDDIL